MKRLASCVAIVTGGSRGGGRGIAVELGAAGATVYVTGRTTRGVQPSSYATFMTAAKLARMPGTIDDTADEVTAAGGRGIAVRCDHSRPDEVRELIDGVIVTATFWELDSATPDQRLHPHHAHVASVPIGIRVENPSVAPLR